MAVSTVRAVNAKTPLTVVAFAVGAWVVARAEPVATAPEPLHLELTLTEVDGGALALDGGVPTDHALRLMLPARAEDLRLRLVDASDRLVPAQLQLRADAQTTVRVVPETALRPAATYRAIAEPETADVLRDDRGRPLQIPDLVFKTSGTPEPVRPPPRRRRHHRR